jgi:hypothetical protein
MGRSRHEIGNNRVGSRWNRGEVFYYGNLGKVLKHIEDYYLQHLSLIWDDNLQEELKEDLEVVENLEVVEESQAV